MNKLNKLFKNNFEYKACLLKNYKKHLKTTLSTQLSYILRLIAVARYLKYEMFCKGSSYICL